MAILMFASGEATDSMHPQTPSFTADDIFTSKAGGITAHTIDVAGNEGEIFLQTPGAKAIAGVFAFASIIVTCVQV